MIPKGILFKGNDALIVALRVTADHTILDRWIVLDCLFLARSGHHFYLDQPSVKGMGASP